MPSAIIRCSFLLSAAVLVGGCQPKSPFARFHFPEDPYVVRGADAAREATLYNRSEAALLLASGQADGRAESFQFVAVWVEGLWLMAAVDMPPAGPDGPTIGVFRRPLLPSDRKSLIGEARTALRWRGERTRLGDGAEDFVVLYAFHKGHARTTRLLRRSDDLAEIGRQEPDLIVDDTREKLWLREQGRSAVWLLGVRDEILKNREQTGWLLTAQR